MNNSNNQRKIFDQKYEIFEIVGKGRSSVVYHAKLLEKNLDVAIKVLVGKQTAINKELLRKESLSLVSCRHESVVKLEDFQVLDNLCYLVMEYAKYNDISKFLKGNVLEYRKGEKYLIKILEVLDFIHKIGFIHRDICPENILVFEDDVVKLGDFGLSEITNDIDKNLLKIGIEKKDFVAPEYFNNGKIDFTSDIYSLGATFFYLFTHSKSLNTDLIKNKKLSFCIKKMVMPNKNERFESAGEVLDFLNARNPISLEASRRLTKDHLENIATFEEEFEKIGERFKKDKLNEDKLNQDRLNQDKRNVDKERSIKDKKNDYDNEKYKNNIQNNIESNIENKESKTYKRDTSKRDTRKATLTKASKEELLNLKIDDALDEDIESVEDIEKRISSVYGIKKNRGISKKIILFLILLFAIALLFYPNDSSDKKFNKEKELSELQTEALDIKLSFPNLENGLYEGELEKIIFDKVGFVISVKDNFIVFKVKSEGFLPVMFDNSNNKEEMEIRFNGVILVFKATSISNGVITGNVVNKITGEKGTWNLRLYRRKK